MSLEAYLQENTAAVKELTAVLKETNAARSETLAKVEALAAEKPKATRAKAAETAAAVSPPPPPAAAAVSPPPPPAATAAATTTATVSANDLAEAFGSYLGIEDEAERTERKAFVKSLLIEVGAGRVGEIKEEDRPRALQLLRNKIQGDKHKIVAEDDLM